MTMTMNKIPAFCIDETKTKTKTELQIKTTNKLKLTTNTLFSTCERTRLSGLILLQKILTLDKFILVLPNLITTASLNLPRN